MRILFASLTILFGTVANGQDLECILLIPDDSFSRDFCDLCQCCKIYPILSEVDFPNQQQDFLKSLQQRQAPISDAYPLNVFQLNGACNFDGSSFIFSGK